MELIGITGKNSYKIRIERDDEHYFKATVDDRTYRLGVTEPMSHLYSILHGNQSYEVRVHRKANTQKYDVHFFRDSFEVEITDPLQFVLAESRGAADKGEAVLEAAMPGKVQRILVKEGEEVVEDQGLVVLLAMKMENELGSPKAGTVKKVLVKEGDNVEGGTALMVVG